MNFQPNDEQRMLCDSARKFLSREFPLARVRETESRGLTSFLPVYREMGSLGFLGIGIAEEAGGSGGQLSFGRHSRRTPENFTTFAHFSISVRMNC